MNIGIFGDFETTGIPSWKEPSGGDNQPHIVSAAALAVDMDTANIIQTVDLIVRPNGWDIPQETIDIHGITKEHAMDVGISEEYVIGVLVELCKGRTQIFYNTTFDRRIARIATKRYLSVELQDQWHSGDYACAMFAAKNAMKVKSVKLVDAYKHFTGKELTGAHTAMADTLAAKDVWFAINPPGSPVPEKKPAPKAKPASKPKKSTGHTAEALEKAAEEGVREPSKYEF